MMSLEYLTVPKVRKWMIDTRENNEQAEGFPTDQTGVILEISKLILIETEYNLPNKKKNL